LELAINLIKSNKIEGAMIDEPDDQQSENGDKMAKSEVSY